MTRSDRLRLKDLRNAYRLIGECRELGADPNAWRSHLLGGLRLLTGGQLGMYMHIEGLNTAAERIDAPLAEGFNDPSDHALWERYQRENAHRIDLFHQRYYADFKGGLRVRCLDSVVDMREWHRSGIYNEFIRACRLGDRITSSIRLKGASPGAIQVLVLHRSAADGRYSRRDLRMVRLLHHEIEPMFGRQLALPGEPHDWTSLPHRLQQVLVCLLQGLPEKEIAARLGISRHTVNRHVQRLYRHFGARSRGELTFRCRELPRLLLTRAADSR